MGMCCENKTMIGEEMYRVLSGGSIPRGRPKRTWREVVQKDCQVSKLNRENAVDHGKWRKLIKDG